MRAGSVIAAALIFAGSVQAQRPGTEHDGYWWREQSATVKVGYVIGCMDHVATANPRWSGDVIFERVPTFNEVCDGLDAFYAAPTNRAVPLQLAIPKVILMLARAASNDR